jgi:hypothetical protein
MAFFSSFVAFRKLRDGHDVEKNVMANKIAGLGGLNILLSYVE